MTRSGTPSERHPDIMPEWQLMSARVGVKCDNQHEVRRERQRHLRADSHGRVRFRQLTSHFS
jgi:hypothetical protein